MVKKLPLLLISFTIFLLFPQSIHANIGEGFYSTNGSKIVDSQGKEVVINGINWGGLYFSPDQPANLDLRMQEMKNAGFDTLRFLFTTEGLDAANRAKYLANLDEAVNLAQNVGLKIILDRHRLKFSDTSESELWYSSDYSERRWIDDWKLLAERYKSNSTVIGADLHNEPHGQACWNCDSAGLNWKAAAQRAGNEILKVNPNWLIIVEGVEKPGQTWWGADLRGVRTAPITLSKPNKLVYSTHEYGPAKAPGGNPPYLFASNFPNNLNAAWRSLWGYIAENNIAPVLVGEFGTYGISNTPDQVWFRHLLQYMGQNKIHWTYFTWYHKSDGCRICLANEREKGVINWTPRQIIMDDLKTIMNNTTPTPTPPNTLPGDINNDNHVNDADFELLKPQLETNGTGYLDWFKNYGRSQ